MGFGIINFVDAKGNSSLHLAAQENDLEIVELLLQNVADKDLSNIDGELSSQLAQDNGVKESINNYKPHAEISCVKANALVGTERKK